MPTITEVAAELESYCAAHPGVCDTLEGIAWWLAMQRCNETTEQLRAVVDQLVERRVLEPVAMADGTTLFACACGGRGGPPVPRG